MTQPPQLTVQVRRASGAAIIDMTGDVTGFAEELLGNAYNDASQGRTQAIILNFSNVDYMNSSGIGVMVTLLIRAQRAHQQFLAYGLSEHYVQIFELTRLNEAIHICENEASALAAVKTTT
jgi:anti-sigma B factor antagonist